MSKTHTKFVFYSFIFSLKVIKVDLKTDKRYLKNFIEIKFYKTLKLETIFTLKILLINEKQLLPLVLQQKLKTFHIIYR